MTEAILNRVSTRTFKKEQLTLTEIKQIKDVLNKFKKVEGPFGHSFEFTFNVNNAKETTGRKIGTYGLIKNVPGFIGGVAPNTLEGIVDFGYVFEHIILSLTELGFDTCWLGGTFNRKDYRKEIEPNEVIPAISPVGRRAAKRSIIDRTLRSAAQSQKRMESYKLFFDYNTGFPLGENTDDFIKDCLELVRRAPSASNKQPWRVFIDKNKAHFYIERTVGYARNMSYDIQALDIGIAMAHFKIGLEEQGIKPKFNTYSVKKQPAKKYISSIAF